MNLGKQLEASSATLLERDSQLGLLCVDEQEAEAELVAVRS